MKIEELTLGCPAQFGVGSVRGCGEVSVFVKMVGREDHFLEGSILGAPFWRWWNRASAGEAGVRPSEDQSTQIGKEEQLPKAAQEPFPSQELEDLIFITAVVPRPRPSSRSPSKSQPIDIPVKKVIPEQVYEIPEDRRYWYQ